MHPRHIIMYIKRTNKSLHRVDPSFSFMLSIIKVIPSIALHIPTTHDFTRDWHVRIKNGGFFFMGTALSSYNINNQ